MTRACRRRPPRTLDPSESTSTSTVPGGAETCTGIAASSKAVVLVVAVRVEDHERVARSGVAAEALEGEDARVLLVAGVRVDQVTRTCPRSDGRRADRDQPLENERWVPP
jgi:hypothetical protein